MIDKFARLRCTSCTHGEFCQSPGSCSYWVPEPANASPQHCQATRWRTVTGAGLLGTLFVVLAILAILAVR